VRLRQILVEDRAAAERAWREIAAGADFAQVARRDSKEPRAAFGGDQGELSRADLPPAFAETIFALAPGEVSEIVAADYGFHLFQVVRRLPAQELTLAEAEPEIRSLLARSNAEGRLSELVGEARDRYNPAVYVRNLPFNYVGRYSSHPG
jgi:peptidyl-prolyl cis-trans isomerase C